MTTAEPTSPSPRRAAFFDVDETLVTGITMTRFLRFHLAAQGRPASVYAGIVDRLRDLIAGRAPRADVVRAYYRSYAGDSVAEVAAHGRAWFDHEHRTGELFRPAVLAAFRRHRARGDVTVLVSGSFSACLDPLAAWLGADLVLAAQPEVAGGVYTGDVVTAMIGADKVAAVAAVLAKHDIRASDCHAYGDHESDLPLLLAVGHPVVVGGDPVLAAAATLHGWQQLPATAG